VWQNPVVITRKKTGELRFCVDFRCLNDMIVQDEFTIPNISDLMSFLKGKRRKAFFRIIKKRFLSMYCYNLYLFFFYNIIKEPNLKI
jgi:hypothetical protein